MASQHHPLRTRWCVRGFQSRSPLNRKRESQHHVTGCKTSSCAGEAPGPNFLEVGTAHGAGTIALALGAKKAGLDVKIQTIDRFAGKFSSRSGFGSVEQNKTIVQENFAHGKVSQCISLFVGSTDEFVAAGHQRERIDLLMLDADGRIDRDLLHFHHLLAPQAVVVIDDIDSGVFLGRHGARLLWKARHRPELLISDELQPGPRGFDMEVVDGAGGTERTGFGIAAL